MRSFLADLESFDPDSDRNERVLAALGPKMLALSAELAGGAHPYFVPVEHTSLAREQLGAGPLLAPEQMVVLETDPTRARQTARRGMQLYLELSNYTKNLRQFGFGDDDFNNGGSDRLVDAIVAWGDPESIAAAIRAQHDAGADHVCVQVLSDDDSVPRQSWRQLAEALA
jgi:probable F420-dependent oxidoreductase